MSDVQPSLIRYVSQREKIAGVANAWRRQYGDTPRDPRWVVVLEKLDALDLSTATAVEIQAIIGNTSWTTETCDVCEEVVEDGWFEFKTWGDRQIMCRNCASKVSIILGAVA